MESSFCFSLASLVIAIPNIRECNSASNYSLTLGKLFHIYELIHFDLKPSILVASYLLAPSLND